jgi:hypothetical protein
MFEVAVTSAMKEIPNIKRFIVVLQSDYDPALISPRLTVIKSPPLGHGGLARRVGIEYLAQIDEMGPVFLMDDDMVIEPGFERGLPFVFDLLARTSTGLIHCGMKHNPITRSHETDVGMLGGGVFSRVSTIIEMGGWGSDVLDDKHAFIKSLLAGFRNYATGQIVNQHLIGAKGGLQAATDSKDRWEKRFRTRSASQLDKIYPGLFRKWDPVHRVLELDKSKLPAKRP